MKKIIYLSGKITGDPNHYEKFLKIETRLKVKFPDAEIVNPARLGDIVKNQSWDFYMRICRILLEPCTAIYMIEDFRDSKGACCEMMIAKEAKKEIMYEICDFCLSECSECKGFNKFHNPGLLKDKNYSQSNFF